MVGVSRGIVDVEGCTEAGALPDGTNTAVVGNEEAGVGAADELCCFCFCFFCLEVLAAPADAPGRFPCLSFDVDGDGDSDGRR